MNDTDHENVRMSPSSVAERTWIVGSIAKERKDDRKSPASLDESKENKGISHSKSTVRTRARAGPGSSRPEKTAYSAARNGVVEMKEGTEDGSLVNSLVDSPRTMSVGEVILGWQRTGGEHGWLR